MPMHQQKSDPVELSGETKAADSKNLFCSSRHFWLIFGYWLSDRNVDKRMFFVGCLVGDGGHRRRHFARFWIVYFSFEFFVFFFFDDFLSIPNAARINRNETLRASSNVNGVQRTGLAFGILSPSMALQLDILRIVL